MRSGFDDTTKDELLNCMVYYVPELIDKTFMERLNQTAFYCTESVVREVINKEIQSFRKSLLENFSKQSQS